MPDIGSRCGTLVGPLQFHFASRLLFICFKHKITSTAMFISNFDSARLQVGSLTKQFCYFSWITIRVAWYQNCKPLNLVMQTLFQQKIT